MKGKTLFGRHTLSTHVPELDPESNLEHERLPCFDAIALQYDSLSSALSALEYPELPTTMLQLLDEGGETVEIRQSEVDKVRRVIRY